MTQFNMFDETDAIRRLEKSRSSDAGLFDTGEFAKAFILDTSSGRVVSDYPSKQLKDPFTGVAGYGESIRQPPYDLDQLASLAEVHPTHAASIEQKAGDVIGSGFELSVSEDRQPNQVNDEERRRILRWWNLLFDEYTSTEVLLAMCEDYMITGWCMCEVARDTDGRVRRLFYVPAQTVRATVDEYKFVQMREGKTVWFKIWGLGPEIEILKESGERAPEGTDREQLANELLVFRKPSRNSHWYNVPMYIASLGFITLSIAAREFNLRFFENFREPRHLIIVSGMQQDVDMALRQIRDTWQQTLRDNPHSNAVLPVYGGATIAIERLHTDTNDMHFIQLIEMSDTEILLSHRMPPDRLGVVKRGFLGGDVSLNMTQNYKSGVVSKSQLIFTSRLQKFIEKELAEGRMLDFRVDFEELDVTDIQMDVAMALDQMNADLITINEARQWLNREALEKYREKGEDLTLSEYHFLFERRFAEEEEELGGLGGFGGGDAGGGPRLGGGGPGGGLGGGDDAGGGAPDAGGDAGGGPEPVETSASRGLGRFASRKQRERKPNGYHVKALRDKRNAEREAYERADAIRRYGENADLLV